MQSWLKHYFHHCKSYLVILCLSVSDCDSGLCLITGVCVRDFLLPLFISLLFVLGKPLFFFFFMVFCVFIQVDGVSTVENFLPACIVVSSFFLSHPWSIMLCFLTHWSLLATLTHVAAQLNTMKQTMNTWEERCLHRHVYFLLNGKKLLNLLEVKYWPYGASIALISSLFGSVGPPLMSTS